MLKKLSEKLGAKFPTTTPGCSMLKITRLDDALSEVLLTASKPSRSSITAAKTREKEKKERRKKIPKIEKPKDVGHFLVQKLSQNFDFCACPSHNALKRHGGGKTGKLLCCKRVFDWIKGNLAQIQPKNDQNVQKTHFLQKVPGVNGLRALLRPSHRSYSPTTSV